MTTKVQSDQLVNEAALQEMRQVARSTGDLILAAVNANFRSPMKLRASFPTPDSKLVIMASQQQMGDGAGASVDTNAGQIVAWPETTLDFQTGAVAGGGTINGSTFSVTLPTTTVGQFRRAVFTRKGNGSVSLVFSAAAASVAALANPATLLTEEGESLGWVDLEATASTAYKTAGSSTNIVENSVGGVARIVRIPRSVSFALGNVGSSPNAKGAVWAAGQLTLQPADASNPGVITAGSQTIGGVKTFSNATAATSATAAAMLVTGGIATANLFVGAGASIATNNSNASGVNPTNAFAATSGEIGLQLQVIDGTRNRRAKFYVSDTSSEFGFWASYSTVAPTWVIGIGTNRSMVVKQNGFIGLNNTDPEGALHSTREGGNEQMILEVASSGASFHRGLYITRRSRGTVASKATVNQNDFLASFEGQGYDGTSYGDANDGWGPKIRFFAEENYTSLLHGSYMTFNTTAGTNSNAERMRLTSLGNLLIGATTNTLNAKLKFFAPNNAGGGLYGFDFALANKGTETSYVAGQIGAGTSSVANEGYILFKQNLTGGIVHSPRFYQSANKSASNEQQFFGFGVNAGATASWNLYYEERAFGQLPNAPAAVMSVLADGTLQLKEVGTANTLGFKAAASTTSHSYTMPATQGGVSTVLTNDGSGNLSWGSGSGANTQLSNLVSTQINANLSFADNAPQRTFGMINARTDGASGAAMIIKGQTSGSGTDLNGGRVIVQTGLNTGTGSSEFQIETGAPASSSGSGVPGYYRTMSVRQYYSSFGYLRTAVEVTHGTGGNILRFSVPNQFNIEPTIQYAPGSANSNPSTFKFEAGETDDNRDPINPITTADKSGTSLWIMSGHATGSQGSTIAFWAPRSGQGAGTTVRKPQRMVEIGGDYELRLYVRDSATLYTALRAHPAAPSSTSFLLPSSRPAQMATMQVNANGEMLFFDPNTVVEATSTTNITGSVGNDLEYTAADISLGQGIWLLYGFASVGTTDVGDALQLVIHNQTDAVDLNGSRGPVVEASTVGNTYSLTTKPIVINNNAGTKVYRIKLMNNGASTPRIGYGGANLSAENGITAILLGNS